MYKAYKNKWTKLLATLMDLFPYHSICRHCFICYQEFEMKKNFYNAATCTDILLMTQCLQYALPEFDAIILYSRPIHNSLVLDQYNNSYTTANKIKHNFSKKKKNNISSTLLKYKFSFRIQCIIWIKLIAIFPYRALFWKERFILWMFICITF